MAAMKSGAVLKFALPVNPGQRLAWESKRLWRKTGHTAAIGIAALAAAVAAHWHTAQLQEREFTLRKQLAAAARAATQPPAVVPTAADGLRAFYAYLPAHAAIPDQLQTLVEIAGKHKVPLARADYKAQSGPHAGFMQYQINLPVKAEYASVQAFMLEAMQAMPALTLDSVAFKRERIDSGDTEARIQFMLLVRKAEGAQ
ncbi:hypothetical protein ASD15_02225 [Massilia sp. Root351]|uniref:hypothetical protein n=1 Tax=Massilia sp. Root351 TaxID=1736522 RepID=UPI00070F5F40|nr:hypothetical protein [Massilia sp. Root351]KQV90901.1 hypothetical protein ASD15_02225 [Massilia sp. Root351]